MGLNYDEARRAAEMAQRQDRCRGGFTGFHVVPDGAGGWQVVTGDDLTGLEVAAAAYYDELRTEACVSRSHNTLSHMDYIWGPDRVADALAPYWESERTAG